MNINNMVQCHATNLGWNLSNDQPLSDNHSNQSIPGALFHNHLGT